MTLALVALSAFGGIRTTASQDFSVLQRFLEDRGHVSEGLASLEVKPRRKDVLLIEGSIVVNPDDSDLVRIEGRLSKTPSFWTRRVDIVRKYQRIGGIRVPVAIESVARVFIAGRSTFRMTYEYETLNGQPVGAPQPRAAVPSTR